MTHRALVEQAHEAINRVFSDRSVDAPTTRKSLEELQTEISVKLDALAEDADAAYPPDDLEF